MCLPFWRADFHLYYSPIVSQTNIIPKKWGNTHTFLGYDAQGIIYPNQVHPLNVRMLHRKTPGAEAGQSKYHRKMDDDNDSNQCEKTYANNAILCRILPVLFMPEISSANVGNNFLALLIIFFSPSFHIHSDIKFSAVFRVIYFVRALQSLGHFGGVIQMQMLHVSVPLRIREFSVTVLYNYIILTVSLSFLKNKLQEKYIR